MSKKYSINPEIVNDFLNSRGAFNKLYCRIHGCTYDCSSTLDICINSCVMGRIYLGSEKHIKLMEIVNET